MKKYLLTLTAMMLAIAASAQTITQAPANAVSRQGLRTFRQATVMKAPMKVDLPTNQKIMGNYVDDALPSSQEAYSLGAAGTYPAGTIITPSVSQPFAGGKVVAIRFAVANSIGASRVFIKPISNDGALMDDVVSVATKTTTAGWNTVELPEPYEVDGATSFLLGFDYVQIAGQYSFFFVGGEIDGGAIIYGNFNGTGWFNFSSYGQTAVQAIVEKDDYPTTDIVISSLDVAPYVKGQDVKYSVTAYNFGTEPLSDYKLTFYVDDNEVETIDGNVTLDGNKQTITGTLHVDGLPVGNHTMTVRATSVNGEAPAANTENDEAEASFLSYTDSKERTKQVVEQFTSTSCTYCPLGTKMLENLSMKCADLEWICIHGTQNPNYPDPYTFTECDDIFHFLGSSSWPSAAFNRMYIDNPQIGAGLVMGIGYNEQYAAQVADIYNIILSNTEAPALTSVDVAGEYDEATRELKITVSGEGVDKAGELLADKKLTVYVIENGLVSRQLNQGTWISDYTHDNVLRQVLTASKGDAITWDGDNFTAEYTTTLDASYKPENMRVTAIVAGDPDKAANQREYYIVNANSTPISDMTLGVQNINKADNAPAAYYTIDGRRTSTPAAGITIVRKADGTVTTVINR